jgi:hypothetical protein
MGHAPPRRRKAESPPSRESFHLGMARAAFVDGSLTIEEFEASVAHVLAGGTLDQRGRVPRRQVPFTREIDAGFGKTVTMHGWRDA